MVLRFTLLEGLIYTLSKYVVSKCLQSKLEDRDTRMEISKYLLGKTHYCKANDMRRKELEGHGGRG